MWKATILNPDGSEAEVQLTGDVVNVLVVLGQLQTDKRHSPCLTSHPHRDWLATLHKQAE